MDELYDACTSGPVDILFTLRENILDAYDAACETAEARRARCTVYEKQCVSIAITADVATRLRAAENDSSLFGGVARRKLHHRIMRALSARHSDSAHAVTSLFLTLEDREIGAVLCAVYNVTLYSA